MQRFFRQLTEPNASVTKEDHRRNARWLMTLMVFVLPIGFLVTALDALLIPDRNAPLRGWVPLLISSAFWLIPYALSKRGRYQFAALTLLLAASVPVFASVLMGAEHLYNLHYLLMPMLVTSVVIRERLYWGLAALQLIAVMVLPLLVEGLSANLVAIEGAAYLVIGMVLIWRVTAHRNELEFARTSELRATNWALKHEIAERKKAEERALQLAIEQERMRVLTAFIGSAAHDFMTPVAGILTSQYLARRATNEDKRTQYLDQIRDQAERIQMLVDALLDMSRLESGSEIEFHTTNIRALLSDACERVQDSINEKQLQLVADLENLTSQIKASAPELGCTFKKLLDNAIQHTPDGGEIHIVANEDNRNLIIEIRDTGEGIQPEAMPHIFDQFYRGDSARSARTGGLGLGLTYVQRVVALHSGTIDVQSTPGSGTTFRVCLPKQNTKALPLRSFVGALI